MADDIRDWANDRVNALFMAECNRTPDEGRHSTLRRAFARYIQQHEKPPIDPLLIEARELCAAVCDDLDDVGGLKASAAYWREKYLSGECDRNKDVQRILVALRGIELASQQGDG